MTDNTEKPKSRRRMAREPKQTSPDTVSSAVKAPSKLDQVEALLMRENGASIAEMMQATGWQQHSVRGAMAGALKRKRGLTIASETQDGMRRYRASQSA